MSGSSESGVSYRGRDGKQHGSGSGGSGSGSGTMTYEDGEIDLIYDEDLADVDNDISLGKEVPDSLEFESNDYEVGDPKGYIDDAIVEDVMKSADERLSKKKSCSIKMVFGAIGIAVFVSIIIGTSFGNNMVAEKKIEERIEDRSSAYDFDDRDQFIKPTVTTKTVITEGSMGELGNPSSEGFEAGPHTVTNKVDPGLETSKGYQVLETMLPLEQGIIFPPAFEASLKDVLTPINLNYDTPLFWQVPFSGGPFQNFMSGCVKKVLASNHVMNSDEMKIHIVGKSKYVNVDLSTPDGIMRAAEKNLLQAGLADVIVSNHVHLTTSTLFGPPYKGRLFTALRHPVDRSIFEYHFVMSTTNIPEVKGMSVEEFVSSRYSDKDWVTRFLINKRQVALTPDDLQLAKEILRRKCLIGLHEYMKESMTLFEEYFGWGIHGEGAIKAHKKCVKQVRSIENSYARDTYHGVGNVLKGSEVYNTIVALNSYDMELYWYAFDLFKEQQAWVKEKKESL